MVVQLFRNEEVQIQSASGLSNEERFSITNDQMAQLQAERILHSRIPLLQLVLSWQRA
jgi:hypothetical protein